MENSIEIQKKDLKNILLILIDKLEACNEKFLLDKDLYWNIPDEQLYEVYTDPTNLTIGSLVEDWEFLQKILKQEREITKYDFYKISNILTFISQV